MFGQDHYDNSWKLIQMANQARLEEANRIHTARLARAAGKDQPAFSLAAIIAPFGRSLRRQAVIVLAHLWD